MGSFSVIFPVIDVDIGLYIGHVLWIYQLGNPGVNKHDLSLREVDNTGNLGSGKTIVDGDEDAPAQRDAVMSHQVGFEITAQESDGVTLFNPDALKGVAQLICPVKKLLPRPLSVSVNYRRPIGHDISNPFQKT
ncbi:hypothetical protein ES707_12558 [subsurface metagenome]